MDRVGEEPAWDECCGCSCLVLRLAELAADGGCVYPFELEVLGQTVQGRDIWAVKIGSRGPEVLMTGASPCPCAACLAWVGGAGCGVRGAGRGARGAGCGVRGEG